MSTVAPGERAEFSRMRLTTPNPPRSACWPLRPRYFINFAMKSRCMLRAFGGPHLQHFGGRLRDPHRAVAVKFKG